MHTSHILPQCFPPPFSHTRAHHSHFCKRIETHSTHTYISTVQPHPITHTHFMLHSIPFEIHSSSIHPSTSNEPLDYLICIWIKKVHPKTNIKGKGGGKKVNKKEKTIYAMQRYWRGCLHTIYTFAIQDIVHHHQIKKDNNYYVNTIMTDKMMDDNDNHMLHQH